MTRSRSYYSRLIGVLLLSVAFSSCGRAGAPRPPEFFAPAQVGNFTASGSVNGVRLQFTAPQSQANGESLIDLEYFNIYRAPYSESGRPDFDLLSRIPYTGPKLEEKEEDPLKNTPKSLKPSGPRRAEAIVVQYLDAEVEPGLRYLYYIEAVNDSGVRGLPSPTLNVTFIGEASQVELFVR